MKQKSLITACIVTSAFIFSCNNSDTENDLIGGKMNEKVEIVYKGRLYTSEYVKKDALIIYTNPGVVELMNKIDQNPNTAMFIDSNGVIEYFDSYDELTNSLNIKNEQTKAVNYVEITNAVKNSQIFPLEAGQDVRLYRDANLQGENISFSCINRQQSKAPYLGNWKLERSSKSWNDQPCSLTLAPGRMITLFRNIDFTGESITFRNDTQTYLNIMRLADYRCSSNRNWDNQATSFVLDVL